MSQEERQVGDWPQRSKNGGNMYLLIIQEGGKLRTWDYTCSCLPPLLELCSKPMLLTFKMLGNLTVILYHLFQDLHLSHADLHTLYDTDRQTIHLPFRGTFSYSWQREQQRQSRGRRTPRSSRDPPGPSKVNNKRQQLTNSCTTI